MVKKNKKLGYAFFDEVLKVTSVFGHFKSNKIKDGIWEDTLIPNYQGDIHLDKPSSWRVVFIGCVILFIFFGIFLRLFHLQVVKGKENKEQADSNRIQLKIIHAPRGVIYDRNGKVLAENNPGFRLNKKLVSRDASLLLEAKNDPDFKKLELDSIRHYPFGQISSHVLGYLGQISDDELKTPEFQNYKPGDRIGRSGVEQVYESILRGKDGAEIIEIDAAGNKLRTIRKNEPIPGENIYLSIDINFQKVVAESLEKEILKAKSCCGTAVVSDPKTGQILSMVSYPSFDSNSFTDPEKNLETEEIFSNQYSPMLNRAISGTYAPGSTFKIASSLAALASGKITKNTQFEDTGVYKIGIWSFSNWSFTSSGRVEGMVDMVKAIERSNDTYFYHVGEILGEKILGDFAKKIGFGKKLGIDLPGEEAGLIPDNEWKKKNVGDVWYPGDSLHMAIGQGFVLTTPLQILNETVFVANDGNLLRPQIVSKIVRQNGEVIKEFEPEKLGSNLFKKSDIDLIKKGLSLVPKSGGTAYPFFNYTIDTSGKTGTAETNEPKKTHAWYTSYAPSTNPEIVVTVLIEKGGEGSDVAVPVVKNIYNWYFSPDKNNIKNFDAGAISTESARVLGE